MDDDNVIEFPQDRPRRRIINRRSPASVIEISAARKAHARRKYAERLGTIGEAIQDLLDEADELRRGGSLPRPRKRAE